MAVIVHPSTLEGSARAPPSKSLTHRYITIAALQDGPASIGNPLYCRDTQSTLLAVKSMGAEVRKTEAGLEIRGGSLHPPAAPIHCGESGTTIRLLASLCATLGGTTVLTGAPGLARRPHRPLLEALRQLGAEARGSPDCLPITVKGPLKGGKAKLPGDVSSQFVSSILLSAPYALGPVELEVEGPLESRPYVEMTLEVMREAGVRPRHTSRLSRFRVEPGEYRLRAAHVGGDWSSAAYLLAAGALCGRVRVEGLKRGCQADQVVVGLLEALGAQVKVGPCSVEVERGSLEPVEADLRQSPDLFPLAACLAAAAGGVSRLRGLGRLKYKESDRLRVTVEGLERMGVETRLRGDELEVYGGAPLGATVDPHGDHRIAMSFAVLGLFARGETRVLDPRCVGKSFPGFWGVLSGLGGVLS